jgi:hypothetical protein
MPSLLNLDQTTLANMTAALAYACRKLPPDRDNQAIRKHIASEISSMAHNGQTSLGDLTNAGLRVANDYLFPPSRPWLRALDRVNQAARSWMVFNNVSPAFSEASSRPSQR